MVKNLSQLHTLPSKIWLNILYKHLSTIRRNMCIQMHKYVYTNAQICVNKCTKNEYTNAQICVCKCNSIFECIAVSIIPLYLFVLHLTIKHLHSLLVHSILYENYSEYPDLKYTVRWLNMLPTTYPIAIACD